jgi:bacterioferritin
MSAYLANPQRDRIHPFLSDVAEIRRRARQHIEEGATSSGHATDQEAVLRLLNAALATELVCLLRYRRYSVMDAEAVADAVKSEFMKRAQEEQGHAEQIAARIVELGGEPNLDPLSASDRGDGEYAEDEMLTDMLAEDLIAERIAIDTYREIIRYLGEHDTTTCRLIESIVAVEQEHAEELASMRENMRRQDRAPAATNHSGGPIEEMR